MACKRQQLRGMYMLKNLFQYGDRDRDIETYTLAITTFLLGLVFIRYTEIMSIPQTVDQVTSSRLLSDQMLALFRTGCALLSLVTLIWVAYDPKGSPDFPLYYNERKNRLRHSSGLTRLAAYTMWHFALFGLSFTISAICSWIHISGGVVPNWMLIVSPILFSTSYTCSILVTCVVTFHIIDTEINRGNNIDHLFYWYEIVMHNLNVILLGIAIIVNNYDIDWRYLVFPIIFSLIYIFWARLYVNIAGVYIYNFIDPRLNGAPIIHFILLLIIILIFAIVLFLNWLVSWNLLLGVLVISGLTNYIIKLKKPDIINN